MLGQAWSTSYLSRWSLSYFVAPVYFLKCARLYIFFYSISYFLVQRWQLLSEVCKIGKIKVLPQFDECLRCNNSQNITSCNKIREIGGTRPNIMVSSPKPLKILNEWPEIDIKFRAFYLNSTIRNFFKLVKLLKEIAFDIIIILLSNTVQFICFIIFGSLHFLAFNRKLDLTRFFRK